MALNKTALSASILNALNAAFDAAKNPDNDGAEIREQYCNAIADAFDDYVKSATITLPTASIQVQGTAVSQQNVVPLAINDAIN
jgi:hypothetical protein